MILKLSLMLPRITLALLLLVPAAASAQDLDTALSAMVRISGTRGDTPVRGSGFVVGLDRDKATIVTASHVIEGVSRPEVTFAADPAERFSVDAVLGMESGNPRGLAVLRIRGRLPARTTAMSFDIEAQLQRGEDLLLLGYPQMALTPLTLRRGFAGPNGNLLQLDGPVGEGFSGAPVLQKGSVVGVVTDEDPQLTYAVKATVARDAVVGWGGKLGGQSSVQIKGVTKTSPVVEECVLGKEETTESGIVFVRICPGTFTMGLAGNDPQAEADEKPAHQVKLSEFWISKTEITNKQFRHFRSYHLGEAGMPATNISWIAAKIACEHFGGRLPTEAEWEYAARADNQAAWSFGDDENMLGEYGWYENNSDNTPQPVGTRKPNAWGLYDMHGNVWEWVADWYGPYLSTAQSDPLGPTAGEERVLRGGAFLNSPRDLRSSFRSRFVPEVRSRNIGFRCVRSVRRQT